MNKCIVIVTYQYSIVVKGIEKHLTDEGFNILVISENSEEMEEYAKKAALFIVYLPDKLLEDGEAILSLEGIHGVLQDTGKSMIVIGEKQFHKDFLKKIPALEDHFWLDRPIDKEVLMHMIKKVISLGEKKEGNWKVLIVDDDPSYAKIIREWLRDHYQVYVLTTGKLVMNFLQKNKVDLILLDYEMPVMDGPEVFKMLSGNPATNEIPVVFLTGVNTKERITQVMGLRPAGYILKSTTKDELLAKLDELI